MNEIAKADRTDSIRLVFAATVLLLLICNPVSAPWLLDRATDVFAPVVVFLGDVLGMIWSVLASVFSGLVSLF